MTHFTLGLLCIGIFLILTILIRIFDEKQDSDKRRLNGTRKQNGLYTNLLKDQRWIAKRNRILRRDGFRCRMCGDSANLQVHHKWYEILPNGQKADPWDYIDSAFITLCASCHENVHSKIKVRWMKRTRPDRMSKWLE